MRHLRGRLLFLTGMMGSGKTTLGRLLARKLGWRFVDIDTLIERRSRMSVPRIFARHGERRFRSLESAALRSLDPRQKAVVATGGGSVLRAANRALMRARGLTVYLKAGEALLWRRVGRRGRGTRPLLDLGRPALRRAFRRRAALYARADLTLLSRGGPRSLAAALIKALQRKAPGFCAAKPRR